MPSRRRQNEQFGTPHSIAPLLLLFSHRVSPLTAIITYESTQKYGEGEDIKKQKTKTKKDISDLTPVSSLRTNSFMSRSKCHQPILREKCTTMNPNPEAEYNKIKC